MTGLPEGSFRKVIPILRVKDLAKSVKWYTEVLGFQGGEIDGPIASIARGTKSEVRSMYCEAASAIERVLTEGRCGPLGRWTRCCGADEYLPLPSRRRESRPAR